MGLFRTIHGAKVNLLATMALCGFYLLAAVWLDFNRVPGIEALGMAFLAVLVLYGLWTESPFVVLLTLGAISWLWIFGAVENPGAAPQLSADDLVPAAYVYALAPVVAAGLGILARAWLFQRRPDRAKAEPAAE